jgi:hypothetical protein
MATATTTATPTPRPVAVQIRLGGRWIAGEALSRRTGPGGGEVLVSHHGHLVWVDQHSVRNP